MDRWSKSQVLCGIENEIEKEEYLKSAKVVFIMGTSNRSKISSNHSIFGYRVYGERTSVKKKEWMDQFVFRGKQEKFGGFPLRDPIPVGKITFFRSDFSCGRICQAALARKSIWCYNILSVVQFGLSRTPQGYQSLGSTTVLTSIFSFVSYAVNLRFRQCA